MNLQKYQTLRASLIAIIDNPKASDADKDRARAAASDIARSMNRATCGDCQRVSEGTRAACGRPGHDDAPAPAQPLRSTERTAAGLQTLAPWAAAIMDTTSRLRTRGTTDVPMPLFTQNEDAAARAEASRQTTLFGDSAE